MARWIALAVFALAVAAVAAVARHRRRHGWPPTPQRSESAPPEPWFPYGPPPE